MDAARLDVALVRRARVLVIARIGIDDDALARLALMDRADVIRLTWFGDRYVLAAAGRVAVVRRAWLLVAAFLGGTNADTRGALVRCCTLIVVITGCCSVNRLVVTDTKLANSCAAYVLWSWAVYRFHTHRSERHVGFGGNIGCPVSRVGILASAIRQGGIDRVGTRIQARSTTSTRQSGHGYNDPSA